MTLIVSSMKRREKRTKTNKSKNTEKFAREIGSEKYCFTEK